MKKDNVVEYIARFHDCRDLYCDVLLRIKDFSNHTYNEIYMWCDINTDKIILNSFSFDDDGDWELQSLDKLSELSAISLF